MSENCESLHRWFNRMRKLNFPFDEKGVPLNGIYILFEKGEFAHGTHRIVRVGTHTGVNQLRSRLKQHFIQENKDRSIFRKNIGRAILNRDNDPFLRKWELDLTTRKAKEKYSDSIDFDKQKEVEMIVTQYIQDNFSFVTFQVDDKEKRLEIESKIISTVSLCNECTPSGNWLGLFSTKEKIRRSGLWLVNELYKEALSGEDLDHLRALLETREENDDPESPESVYVNGSKGRQSEVEAILDASKSSHGIGPGDIDESLDEFERELRKNPYLAEGTIDTHLRRVRTFLRWCKDEGLYVSKKAIPLFIASRRERSVTENTIKAYEESLELFRKLVLERSTKDEADGEKRKKPQSK